ncbi:MAG: GAF domain-containing protein [Candidatus Electrothrix sp. AUS1_2]|nr:GAF domain-containing protein [Candidatus Electrothrix sp. AUS1_2]
MQESLPANEGIPRYLIEERDTCNVLVYRDLHEAVRKKVFPEAEDEALVEKVGSLAVAPLKAWDGKKKSMIGMVYLVSGRKKVFREEHIDAIRFLADILGDALASSVTVNYMLIMKGNKNARRRQLLEKY